MTAVPLHLHAPTRRRCDECLKCVADVVVALVLLVLTLPLLVAVAAAIKVDSRGPVFYGCRRVGFHGREFSMLKFRKMVASARGPALTADADCRFTRIGRLLAASKLDELPQLLNVLRGEMSLVGPRPEDAGFVALHLDAYALIHSVRPGITGLSQLAFAKESRVLGAADPVGVYVSRILPQKVAIDGLYAARRSLVLDGRILAWTALAVLLRKDVSVDRASGRLALRRRPATGTPDGRAESVAL